MVVNFLKRRSGIVISVLTVFFLNTVLVGLSSGQDVLYEELFFITSKDGTRLATSLARPDSEGKFPAIIQRSPYGSRKWSKRSGQNYARKGFVYIVQDVRGRYDSEGVFDPFVYGITDGEATLKWVRSQPWSNGRIGATGNSYVGFTALYTAAGNEMPPDAIVVRHPVASPAGGLYRGGAMIHHFDYYWSLLVDGKTGDLNYIFSLDWDSLFGLLPLMDAHKGVNKEIIHYQNWVKWANGSFGKGKLPDPSSISGENTAILLVGGWFDLFCRDVIALFQQLNPDGLNKKVKLIVGPFDHSLSPPPCDMKIDNWNTLNVSSISDQWIERWIIDEKNSIEDRPAVEFFILGENRWASSTSWPPPGVKKQSLYLHSNRTANSSDGSGRLDEQKPGREKYDKFVYNPVDPVPSKGGILCCLRKMTKAGPMDQSEIEKRDDVLVYTTDVLSENITIAGPVELELYASTSARDTDFTGKLVDVYPDGKALNITDGIIRARFRKGLGEPEFIRPGKVVKYSIELGHVAMTFLKGHRLRLEISSSNFPKFDRNHNTGGKIGTETGFEKATQKIYHDRKRASRLILTIWEEQ